MKLLHQDLGTTATLYLNERLIKKKQIFHKKNKFERIHGFKISQKP